MHAAVKVIVGLAAVGVIGGVPAAAALATSAAPTGSGLATMSANTSRVGTSYFAPTTSGGGMAILLSRDQRQVRRTVYAFQQTCTDGTSNFNWDQNVSIPISAAGTFKASYDSGPQTDARFPGETTRYVTSISGVISRSGAKIVGTTRVTFTITKATGSVNCDTGLVRFTAKD